MHLHKYNYIESSARLCGVFSCWCLASKHCSSSRAKKIYYIPHLLILKNVMTQIWAARRSLMQGYVVVSFLTSLLPSFENTTKEFLIRNALLEVAYLKICGFNNFIFGGGGFVVRYIYNFHGYHHRLFHYCYYYESIWICNVFFAGHLLRNNTIHCFSKLATDVSRPNCSNLDTCRRPSYTLNSYQPTPNLYVLVNSTTYIPMFLPTKEREVRGISSYYALLSGGLILFSDDDLGCFFKDCTWKPIVVVVE